jgi:hypothetical protein
LLQIGLLCDCASLLDHVNLLPLASKVVSMLVEPVRPTIQVTEKAENPGLISAKVCPLCPIKSACGLRNLLTMSGSYKVADALRKI